MFLTTLIYWSFMIRRILLYNEERYINLGRFHDTIILFVITVDKADGDTQIITAREATPKEQEVYNEHYRKSTDSGGN